MTTPTPRLEQALRAIRARRSAARTQGVELVGVIGSVARGDAQSDSDVDVVYRVIGRPSLFDVGEILMDLQDDLGCRVDLVDLGVVKPRLRAVMELDLVRA